MSAATSSRREELHRRGLLLERFTITRNAVEGPYDADVSNDLRVLRADGMARSRRHELVFYSLTERGWGPLDPLDGERSGEAP